MARCAYQDLALPRHSKPTYVLYRTRILRRAESNTIHEEICQRMEICPLRRCISSSHSHVAPSHDFEGEGSRRPERSLRGVLSARFSRRVRSENARMTFQTREDSLIISVIITAFNRKRFLRDAILSALN